MKSEDRSSQINITLFHKVRPPIQERSLHIQRCKQHNINRSHPRKIHLIVGFFIIARLCNSQLSVVYVVVFCCYKVIVVDQGTLWYNIFALFRKVRPIHQTHKAVWRMTTNTQEGQCVSSSAGVILIGLSLLLLLLLTLSFLLNHVDRVVLKPCVLAPAPQY